MTETFNTSGCCLLLAQSIAGLDHLEGQEVTVIADGNIFEEQTVASGTITFTGYYANISAGLPFVSDLEQLNDEITQQDGTIQGSRVKVGNVIFRFINSRGGFVGESEDSLYNAFTNDQIAQHADDLEFCSSDDNDIANLYTGDIRVPSGIKYNNGTKMFYRQIAPLPVSIGAIIKEIDIGKPCR